MGYDFFSLSKCVIKFILNQSVDDKLTKLSRNCYLLPVTRQISCTLSQISQIFFCESSRFHLLYRKNLQTRPSWRFHCRWTGGGGDPAVTKKVFSFTASEGGSEAAITAQAALDISRCPFTVKTRVRKKVVRSHRVASATEPPLPISGPREKTRADS